jgi:hypothetical protein
VVFVTSKSFQHSLMFVSEARAYPRVEHLKGVALGIGSGLTRKNNTRLERLVRDKHSSLLQTFLIPELTRVKHLQVLYSKFKLLASPENTRLGWKGFPGTNTLAYYENP